MPVHRQRIAQVKVNILRGCIAEAYEHWVWVPYGY
jgi:hypothetical protein